MKTDSEKPETVTEAEGEATLAAPSCSALPGELPQRTHSQWLNRKLFTLSAETHQGFKRVKKVLNCKLCGHILQVGDKARWIYANGTPGMGTGNFFVCGDCDGEDATVLAKAKEQFAMAVTLSKRWGIYGPDWQH